MSLGWLPCHGGPRSFKFGCDAAFGLLQLYYLSSRLICCKSMTSTLSAPVVLLQALQAQELDARARLVDAEARAARAGTDADAAEARLAAAAQSLEERTAAAEAARAAAALEQEHVASGSAQLLALGQKVRCLLSCNTLSVVRLLTATDGCLNKDC